MVLRDIFEKIGNIYNFSYEKNKNGSYRVNSVIRELMYPSLYNDKAFTDRDIAYFLKNTQYSYQAYPNIKNSFSELMNPREGNHRFPILEFIDLIDVAKLYDYYKYLNSNLDEISNEALNNFISDILDNNPLLNAKLRVICVEPYEYISWIILFSMFSEGVLEKKYTSFSSNTHYNKEKSVHYIYSNLLSSKNNTLSIFTIVVVALIVIEMFVAFTPYIFSDYYNALSTHKQNMVMGAILLYTLSLLVVWSIHSQYTFHVIKLRNLYDSNFDSVDVSTIEKYSHFKFSLKLKMPTIYLGPDSNLQKKRAQIRRISTLTVCILCALTIIPAIYYQSFPLLVSLGTLYMAVDIWIDRILNDKRVRKYYDSLSLQENMKPNALRGLAKIYSWEYKKTKFDYKNNYYNYVISIHSNDCYKSIFTMAYDRIKWRMLNCYLLVVYFNFFLITLALLNNIFPGKHEFLKLPNNLNTQLMVIIYLLSANIFCIITVITSDSMYDRLTKLYLAHNHVSTKPEETERSFLQLQKDNLITKIDITRGIFTYNLNQFESGKLIEDINPESDRMLFFHRKITFNNFCDFNLLVSEIILNVFFTWHLQLYYLFLPISISLIIINLIIKKFVIPNLHRKKIIKAIQKL